MRGSTSADKVRVHICFVCFADKVTADRSGGKDGVYRMLTNYRDDCFISDGTNWCGGVAASGELWLDKSLNPITNYTSSWNKIVPAGWTVKYVGIDDQ